MASKVARTSAAPLTDLLVAWGQGDERALAAFTPLVYNELRRLAQWHLVQERPGITLQATALVNEAYLRLVGVDRVRWQDRAHFFAMAARQMRRVLIDAARQRRSQKRGGGARRVSLAASLGIHDRSEDLIALDDALAALTRIDPRRGQVVELKFFGGLTFDEIAHVLRVSTITIKRDWKLARAWLAGELRKA